MKSLRAGAIALVTTMSTTQVHAQDYSGWYLQVGPAQMQSDANISSATIGGAPLAGAGADLSTADGIAARIAYRFANDISVGATVGTPPRIEVAGTGTFAGLDVGTLSAGPLAFTANYHFNGNGKFQPHLGAGFAYFLVLDTKDGALTDFTAENTFAGVLEVGFDYWASEKAGFFLNAKRVFGAETTFEGNAPAALGGAPVSAEAELDATIIHAGVTFRF